MRHRGALQWRGCQACLRRVPWSVRDSAMRDHGVAPGWATTPRRPGPSVRLRARRRPERQPGACRCGGQAPWAVCTPSAPVTWRPSSRGKGAERWPGPSRGPGGACAPERMPVESLHPRAAPTIGAGHVTPRVAQAAQRSARLVWVRGSGAWPRRPGPVGGGRRRATSSGRLRGPSPLTTQRRTPARPGTGRGHGPRSPVPTSPRGGPSGRNTAAAPSQRQGQRLGVAGLFAWGWRPLERRLARPTRRRRVRHERVGRAPSSLEGTGGCHPRTRGRSWPGRPPKRVGNRRPTRWPHRCGGACTRPAISAPHVSGPAQSGRA